jgi:hypothetical protein
MTGTSKPKTLQAENTTYNSIPHKHRHKNPQENFRKQNQATHKKNNTSQSGKAGSKNVR